MDSDDLLNFLQKSQSDEELLLMCQAAVDEMGPQGFMDTITPAAAEAVAAYEQRLEGIEEDYRNLSKDVPDRVVRIGILSGALLDAPLDKIDIASFIAVLIDWLFDAKEQVEWLSVQNSILEGQLENGPEESCGSD